MTINIFADQSNNYYLDIVELGTKLKISDGEIEKVPSIPSSASATIFDSTMSGFLDNARTKNWKLFANPSDLLFIISELKTQLGE